jgi:BirA family biotin operon repressor/biotin-[acetyl-CoA-carboxylase] ligase
MSRLYRRRGYHPYTDAAGVFMAKITDIREDGRLVLTDESGRERTYGFKEVQFVILGRCGIVSLSRNIVIPK